MFVMRCPCRGPMFSDGVRSVRGAKMSEFRWAKSWVAVPSRHALGAWVAPTPTKRGQDSLACRSIYLFAAARPQSSDTEGAPPPSHLPPTPRRVASSAHLGWFPGYSIGSRRVRAAIKEPSQPCAAAQRAKPHPPDIVWALHTFWVAWLARDRASVQTAITEPANR